MKKYKDENTEIWAEAQTELGKIIPKNTNTSLDGMPMGMWEKEWKL